MIENMAYYLLHSVAEEMTGQLYLCSAGDSGTEKLAYAGFPKWYCDLAKAKKMQENNLDN